MAHRVYVDNVEEVAWRRGYLYADDGNRLERTNLPGDDVDDPQTYTGPYDDDAHGNMILMAQIPGGLTWDDDDRLQSTGHIGGGTVYYVYDGAGQRVRKVTVNQSGTTSKQRLYFGSWETYREHKNINTTNDLDLERETLHVHDDHGRVCLIETKTVHNGNPVQAPANVARYQYSNHLGTANLELDDNADVISYEEFHPYGTSSYRAANTAIEVSAKRYRYTGQERDEETGLAYHGARYYAPWLARWTAADPIGLGDGPNRFAYVWANPISARDLTGAAGDEPTRVDRMRFVRKAVIDQTREGRIRGVGAPTGQDIDSATIRAGDALTAFAEADRRLYDEEKKSAQIHLVGSRKHRRESLGARWKAFWRGDRAAHRAARSEWAKWHAAVRVAKAERERLRTHEGFRGHDVEWISSILDEGNRGYSFTTPLPGGARQNLPNGGYRQPSVSPPNAIELSEAGVSSGGEQRRYTPTRHGAIRRRTATSNRTLAFDPPGSEGIAPWSRTTPDERMRC